MHPHIQLARHKPERATCQPAARSSLAGLPEQNQITPHHRSHDHRAPHAREALGSRKLRATIFSSPRYTSGCAAGALRRVTHTTKGSGIMAIGYVRHSPSALNLFAASPSMFVLERIVGLEQPVGVPAHRGVAVEDGVTRRIIESGCSFTGLHQ